MTDRIGSEHQVGFAQFSSGTQGAVFEHIRICGLPHQRSQALLGGPPYARDRRLTTHYQAPLRFEIGARGISSDQCSHLTVRGGARLPSKSRADLLGALQNSGRAAAGLFFDFDRPLMRALAYLGNQRFQISIDCGHLLAL